MITRQDLIKFVEQEWAGCALYPNMVSAEGVLRRLTEEFHLDNDEPRTDDVTDRGNKID